MVPQTRAQLELYVKRKLGEPVTKINIDQDQLDDRIDEAVTMFQNWHADGTEKWYQKYQVTSADAANGCTQLANTVTGVTRIFTLQGSSTVSSGQSGFNMFDINYQIRLNELYDYTAGDYTYFELANEHLRMLEMLFTGEIPIRFNKYNQILYIDCDWSNRLQVGNFIIIELYNKLDPSVPFWQDQWLMAYATACVKEQWGSNLKKFASVNLPGGMILNGQQIYNEAIAEKEILEKKIIDEFESPAEFFVG